MVERYQSIMVTSITQAEVLIALVVAAHAGSPLLMNQPPINTMAVIVQTNIICTPLGVRCSLDDR